MASFLFLIPLFLGQAAGSGKITDPQLKLEVFDACEFYRSYQENEISADKKWKGQQFAVSGKIIRVEKNGDRVVVIIQALAPAYPAPQSFSGSGLGMWDHFQNAVNRPPDSHIQPFGFVACRFKRTEESRFTDLKSDQKITVGGTGAGKSSGFVAMQDCFFYDPSAAEKAKKAREWAIRIAARDKEMAQEAADETRRLEKIEAAKWRNWTIAGKPVEAKFIKANGAVVTLKKQGRAAVEIPRESLSDEDQAWIKRRGWMTAGNPPTR